MKAGHMIFSHFKINAESNRDWLMHYHQNNLNEEFLLYREYYKNVLKNNKKILIIEDDFISFEFIQKLITDHESGVDCFFAATEVDALDIMKSFECDLVIADYFLENDENGLTICQKIRKLNHRTAFLIVSSLKYNQYQELLKYSIVEPAFLEKPISKRRILKYFDEIFTHPAAK